MDEQSLLAQIEIAEQESRKLEPKAATRKEWTMKAFDYADDFINRIEQIPAFITDNDGRKKLSETHFPEGGSELDDLIEILETEVDHSGLNPASGGHLGYIPGGGIFPSAVGDFLSDVFNRYAGIHFAGPGAVELEHMLIKWMLDMVKFPESAGGTLTSGGSVANLVAIVTARDAKKIRGRDMERTVIYLTEQVHHCVHKAIRIAGMGEAILRNIPMDDRYKMSVSELEKAIVEDKRSGLIPFLVCASTGTTDTGSIDPVDEISKLCKTHDLWLHVDAAYGGFFLLSDIVKSTIRGLELADSIVVDPHKGLFLPYGLGAVLIRQKEYLHQSHYYKANYMQDALKHAAQLSPADLSPELTRPFRGLRMWLPLKLFGINIFKAALDEKILLTRYFYAEIQKIPGMEVGPFPELSVALFRYVPRNGNVNEVNEKLTEGIHKDGRVFMSSTRINGEVWIRIACLCFRTHKSTIDLALTVIKNQVESSSL